MNVGAAGTDNVLTTFATLLTDHLRPTDVAARYTDEIFAVALAGISAAALARRLEMIRQAWNGVRAYTISVSVAIAPILSTPDDALLRATRELAEDAGTPQGFRTSHH
jgi:GGDEF domain-containing protein